MSAVDSHHDEDEQHSLYTHLQEIRDIIQSLHTMNVDSAEWSCLRSIVLFRYCKQGNLISNLYSLPREGGIYIFFIYSRCTFVYHIRLYVRSLMKHTPLKFKPF